MFFAADLVHIKPVHAEAVSFGARPVRVDEHFGIAGAGGIQGFEETVLPQPGIEIEPAPETVEAVIGEYDQGVAGGHGFQCIADEVVHLAVEIFDDAAVLFGFGFHASRVLGIAVAPEHVLDQVGGAEIEKETAAVEVVEGLPVLADAFTGGELGLLEELGFVEGAVAQRLGVLRNSRSVKPSMAAGESFGQIAGVRDGIDRRQGIDVDGAHVKFELGMDRLHEKPDHARHGRRCPRGGKRGGAGNAGGDFYRDPIAPFALVEEDAAAGEAHLGDRIARVADGLEFDVHGIDLAEFAGLAKKIGRALEFRGAAVSEHGEIDEASAADLVSLERGVGSQHGELAVTAEHVGRAHAADAPEAAAARGCRGRVIRGEVINIGVDSPGDEIIPESGAPPQELGVACGQGDLPVS